MLILELLEQVANFDAVLGLVSRVARFLGSLAAKGDQEAQKKEALARTLREWEEIAADLDPRLRQSLKQRPGKIDQRALDLATLAEQYAATPQARDASHMVRLEPDALHHSRITIAGGRVQVAFGQSAQTRALSRERLTVPLDELAPIPKIRRESMPLPTFKITMLGDSSVGKTMFMAAMYAKLRGNPRGVSIKAVDDAVDLELGKVMEKFYRLGEWPLGSEFDQKQYTFELRLRERPIAQIDWVDYRGGALVEGEQTEGGLLLIQRLRESQAILWMVDMTRLTDGRVEGLKQRILTQVDRMAHLCRLAVEEHDDPRAWVFVRTKADTVRDSNGNPNWEKACGDLIKHLGETIDIAKSGRNSRAAALPVSASGRLSLDGSNKVIGDDPLFVEWPLLLALTFLMDVEFSLWRKAKGEALEDLQATRGGKVEDLMRRVLRLGPTQEELQAWGRATAIGRKLLETHKDIVDLLRDCPPVIRVLHERQEDGVI